MTDSVRNVGVLDKSVAIVDALAAGPAALGELVERTGLARPTVHRLAVALEAHDVLRRDEQGRFRLGRRVLAWGRAAMGDSPLIEAAGPVLAALAEATGESAQLYVRDGAVRVCVAAADRRAGLRDTVPVGAVLALDAGSGAKALLAWTEVGELPDRVDPTELAAVRRRGWVASVAEREAGVASVSAPVLDGPRRVVAAVSVSGPLDRLGRTPGRRFGAAVVAAARDLERAAGLAGR
ncbi:MAG: IclR family transcriptional regulator [Actinomycetes bacterium]